MASFVRYSGRIAYRNAKQAAKKTTAPNQDKSHSGGFADADSDPKKKNHGDTEMHVRFGVAKTN